MQADTPDAAPRPASPTRGLTPGFLADRGFAVPKDAAIDRHYRRHLPGGRTVEAFLTNAGPRVMVFRGKDCFEAVIRSEAEMAVLLDLLGDG